VRLEPLARFPGLRVLGWHAGALYAARGYEIARWTEAAPRWEPVGAFDPGGLLGCASRTRLGDRLVRGGCHALARIGDGGLVASFPKVIARKPAGEPRFRTVLAVPRGRRPLGIASTPDGWLFWGEYFPNAPRDAVRVFGSRGGEHWQVVYTFPPGAIRHVHTITYDPYAGCLWVLTGDDGDECRILRVSPDWSSVETVLAGGQQARAVALVPREDAVYYASDTEREQNFIYRLDRRGGVARLAPIAASSFYGCRAGGAVFFSTGVEPSRVNADRDAVLYGSADGARWDALVRWRHDGWHLRLFGYANIVLPSGENDGDILAASGAAVRREDRVTHLWRIHLER
jgi:hypothetical protein